MQPCPPIKLAKGKMYVIAHNERLYLGMKGNSCHPVSVALATHDEITPGQVPHLPGLVITACHLNRNKRLHLQALTDREA